jgi:predicted nucleic acid-binding protein
MFVLDCSVTMAWVFDDEDEPLAANVRDRLADTIAVVPSVWSLETSNALLTAERRGRLTEAESVRFLTVLRSLPINVEAGSSLRLVDELLPLARRLGLTVYAASYLELAMRRGVPLATLDARLCAAAVAVGVGVVR